MRMKIKQNRGIAMPILLRSEKPIPCHEMKLMQPKFKVLGQPLAPEVKFIT